MCGFIGGTLEDAPYQAALVAIAHRGPDSQQVVNLPGMTLGFARLAIVDLRAVANQPMSSPDGHVWICFNGEIYGFGPLREELQSKGFVFETNSDTEVLLNAYLCWGEEFVDRVDGMFAIAILDQRDQRLRLYRDRPGIKPLYCFADGDDICFASELKALEILCTPSRLAVDPTAVYDFLTYGYVPAPKSLYQNTFKLPPATKLVFDLQQRRLVSEVRYWTLPESISPSAASMSADAACEELQALVHTSVKEQLVADVPVGCFLSGGVDSSIVVAEAASIHQSIKTFSIGFANPQFDETAFARDVATHCRTEHTEQIFPVREVVGDFGLLRKWYDEPFADFSAFPTWLVSRLARSQVTVALSGDGGDELFGGYQRYRWHRLLRPFAFGHLPSLNHRARRWLRGLHPRTLRRRLGYLLIASSSDDLRLYDWLMNGPTLAEKQDYARSLEIPADYDDLWYYRKFWRTELPILTRLQHLDFNTYLPDDILTKVDRASMANSLEVRVPLLCRSVIEFAFGLPERLRFLGNQPKGLLKQAFRSRLPANHMDRRKMGFSVPTEYFSGDEVSLRARVLEELFADAIPPPKCDLHCGQNA